MNTSLRTTFCRIAASLLLLGGLAVLPASADARAGFGGSMGSRGSRSYSMPAPTRTAPYGASPFSQSAAPRAPYGSSYGGMMAGRGHPLAAGLLGGFLGAGLAGMMFGHGFYHGGFGVGGLLGLLIQLALIYALVRWLWRRVASPAARGTAPGLAYAQAGGRTQGGGGWAAARPPLALTQADYARFDQTLREVQAAWTRADVPALQRLATPQMAATFAQQLQEQARRGVRNAVSDVRLDQGDLSEAWNEGGRDYATVAMRYSMIDVTTDGGGRVVDGSPQERVSVAEFWTFVRALGGGWVLSAIQQAR